MPLNKDIHGAGGDGIQKRSSFLERKCFLRIMATPQRNFVMYCITQETKIKLTSGGYCRFRSILCWSHYYLTLPLHQMLLLLYSSKENITQMLSGSTNHNDFFSVWFPQVKHWHLKKMGATFSNPCPSLPLQKITELVKQFQSLNNVLIKS